MTAGKLQDILQNKKELTIDEIKQIIYELKNDCVGAAEITNRYECGFYNGEMNAFYICLDLLDKLDVFNKSVRSSYPNCLSCSNCERDVIICKEEGRCLKNAEKTV